MHSLLGMLAALLVVAKLDVVAGKYVEGHLNSHETWAFLARFCFLSDEGQFEYIVEYDKDYGTQNLLLYYDSDSQWPAVYPSNKTCEEKEAVLNVGKNQVVHLTTLQNYYSGCELRNRSDENGQRQVYVCHNVRKFRSARERWWFIAVSNCNSTKGMSLKYKFLMTNGAPGDYWREHFSADEFYILPILMGMSLIYLLMIVAIVMCTVELKSRQLLHSTYKMFVYSVVFQEIGILFQSISFIRYAINGTGYPGTKNFGRLLESTSEIIYLLLMLLLAKGYTVTRGRLRLASSIKLTVFMCIYVITYLCLFWYETMYFDPGLVLYLYESPPGYGLISLRIIAWWMFVYSTVFTLKHYPEKSKFYYSFNIIGTLWFVAGPTFIMAANGLVDKWVRESVVYGALHLIALLGHILFLVLTLPSHANQNFPFHVRTTQIACLDPSLDLNGDASFAHHAYAPTVGNHRARPSMGDWISDVPVELFSISRSVQMSYISRAPMGPVPMPPSRGNLDTQQLALESADNTKQLDLRPNSQGKTLDSRPGSRNSILESRPGSRDSIFDSRPGSRDSLFDSRPGSRDGILESRSGSGADRLGLGGYNPRLDITASAKLQSLEMRSNLSAKPAVKPSGTNSNFDLDSSAYAHRHELLAALNAQRLEMKSSLNSQRRGLRTGSTDSPDLRPGTNASLFGLDAIDDEERSESGAGTEAERLELKSGSSARSVDFGNNSRLDEVAEFEDETLPSQTGSSTQRPSSRAQILDLPSSSSAQRPASSAQRPVSSVKRPGSSTQRPASSAQRQDLRSGSSERGGESETRRSIVPTELFRAPSQMTRAEKDEQEEKESNQ